VTDNVDFFKKIIFRIPSLEKTVAAMLLAPLFYSIIFFACIKLFTPFNPSLLFLSFIVILLTSLPALLSGEILSRFLPDYPRKWGYFLALSCQLILFVYGLIITGADNFINAWHIFWLGLTTVYLTNLLILLLTMGYDYFSRIASLSLVQPLSVLMIFHISLGAELGVGPTLYLSNLTIFAVAGVVLISTFAVAEYLIRSNVDDLSVLQSTSALLQKKQEDLGLGHPTNPDVQTLKISNERGEADISVPWIHPGPIEGFGGGRVTTNIISELNADGDGFFFHVPSTHKSDPSNPEDYSKILDAMSDPKKTPKASEMVNKSYKNVDFYGRKIGDQKLVFMDADWDDYEVPIFKEELDLSEVLIVDLHCQDRKEEERETIIYNTRKAEHLRNCLRDFLTSLEKQKINDYKAGYAVNMEGKPVFALIEQVGKQETLIFGIEGNGTSKKIRRLRKDYLEKFDKVLVFSTDTHQSIHQLASKKQVDINRIEHAVKEATETISEASIGFTKREADAMKLLHEDYSGLIFSINILIRLMILMLMLVYSWLVYWVFF
jgi:putative membrane protein